MSSLDLTKVGLVNGEYYYGDGPKRIRDTAANIEEAIGLNKSAQENIEKNIAQLTQQREKLAQRTMRLTGNLDRIRRAIAPLKNLSEELLQLIFIFCSASTVSLPYGRKMVPSQIILSHVCSTWRRITCSTPAMWNSVYIKRPEDPRYANLYRRWLTRGCDSPVRLAVNLEGCKQRELWGIFWTLIIPFEPRKLKLILSSEQLASLYRHLSVDLHEIPCLDELELHVSSKTWITIQHVPSFVNKTRSIYLVTNPFPDMERSRLPWSQLRHLHCTDATPMSASTCFTILREMPLLEKCGLHVFCSFTGDSPADANKISMSHLQKFDLKIARTNDARPIDGVIRHLILPNLTWLYLNGRISWTADTYSILVRQFNFCRLTHVAFGGHFPLSRVLADAPMLQGLGVWSPSVIDDHAFVGLFTADVGKHLRTFFAHCKAKDVDKVLRIAEVRQKSARKSVESNCNWKEVVTSFKIVDITIVREMRNQWDYAPRVVALKEAGVNIKLHHL
ncbi:hypothetical protein APHAL10511_007974 [Amanita phalloides]|nr:hypothetical protein APHAL10511_007974 [Amanita phalloides]